jgi:hypothetical protein
VRVNAATDTAALLASVTPPAVARASYDVVSGALKRNLARLRHYRGELEEANTPQEVRVVLRRARRQDQQISADRMAVRSALLSIGGSDCALERTPTLGPVFPPAFYAGSPQSPASDQSDQQVPNQSPQTVLPLPPSGGAGPPSAGSGGELIEVSLNAMVQVARTRLAPCGIPL